MFDQVLFIKLKNQIAVKLREAFSYLIADVTYINYFNNIRKKGCKFIHQEG